MSRGKEEISLKNCSLGRFCALNMVCFSEKRRQKREKRRVEVSALCSQHIGKSGMSAHR